MRKAISIPPEGACFVLYLPDDEAAAANEIHAQIDGYLELVSTPHPEIALFVNEHGKARNLPRNIRATVLARIPGDVIVGRVVVCGAADAAGNITDLPEIWVERLRANAVT